MDDNEFRKLVESFVVASKDRLNAIDFLNERLVKQEGLLVSHIESEQRTRGETQKRIADLVDKMVTLAQSQSGAIYGTPEEKGIKHRVIDIESYIKKSEENSVWMKRLIITTLLGAMTALILSLLK